MSGDNIGAGCLNGVRILDLGGTILHQGSGLARRRGGEGRKSQWRRSGPLLLREPPDKDSWYFLLFNASKKSIRVNLKDPAGVALVKDMARRADVMVENFAPGAVERLGLDYDAIRAVNAVLFKIFAFIRSFLARAACHWSRYRIFPKWKVKC